MRGDFQARHETDETESVLTSVHVCLAESALDDLDLNDFGMSALDRSLESTSRLSNVGVMLGTSQPQA